MKNAEWNPGTLLETSGGYWKTCALHAAVQLDVFTVMADQRLSAEDAAEKLVLLCTEKYGIDKETILDMIEKAFEDAEELSEIIR